MKARIVYDNGFYQGYVLYNGRWWAVTDKKWTILGARISLLFWKWFGEFEI